MRLRPQNKPYNDNLSLVEVNLRYQTSTAVSALSTTYGGRRME